jgi:hypothetical protein
MGDVLRYIRVFKNKFFLLGRKHLNSRVTPSSKIL